MTTEKYVSLQTRVVSNLNEWETFLTLMNSIINLFTVSMNNLLTLIDENNNRINALEELVNSLDAESKLYVNADTTWVDIETMNSSTIIKSFNVYSNGDVSIKFTNPIANLFFRTSEQSDDDWYNAASLCGDGLSITNNAKIYVKTANSEVGKGELRFTATSGDSTEYANVTINIKRKLTTIEVPTRTTFTKTVGKFQEAVAALNANLNIK